jgi:hypothetical protein
VSDLARRDPGLVRASRSPGGGPSPRPFSPQLEDHPMIALYAMIATLARLGFAAVAVETIPRTRAGHVYGHVRVSTDMQAASPEAQRRAIEAAARNVGRAVDAWFQDAPVQNPGGSWNDAQSGRVPISDRKSGQDLCARPAKDTRAVSSSRPSSDRVPGIPRHRSRGAPVPRRHGRSRCAGCPQPPRA